MDANRDGGRTLSQFGETWVRQTDADRAPASVGWYLWAVVGVSALFALVELLHPGA